MCNRFWADVVPSKVFGRCGLENTLTWGKCKSYWIKRGAQISMDSHTAL